MLVSNGTLLTTKTPNYEYVAARWTSGGYSDPFNWAAYGSIYRQQLWVAVVVNKRAGLVSRLPLKVYKRADDGRRQTRGHPYAELLRNPHPGLDPVSFWTWTMSTFDIYGEAFWFKHRDPGGRPNALQPLHPTCMHREDDGSWTYRRGTTEIAMRASSLVHFKTYNPDDSERGMSRLEPLRQTLQNEWSARVASSSFWRRGARPGMALMHPGKLGAEAQTRLKVQFDAIASGAENTGTTVVLEEGMRPEIMTVSAVEAQYIESRKLNREEVVAAYDMPPPAVHILDRATFSNVTEQFRSVYRDSLAPPLTYFESVLETQLRQDGFGDDVYSEFLLDGVLRGDFETRQTAYRMADYMTIAEKRELENLPFIDGTDRIVINAASIPLDQIDEVTEARTARQTQALPGTAVRSIMGRLTWQKTAAEVADDVAGDDTTALTAIHAAKAAGDDIEGLKARLRALTRE